MNKLASILVMVFAFTITTQAQKKDKRMRKEKFSIEQQTVLTIKKMTLDLELTAAQQRKMKPLITQQIKDRNKYYEQMKKLKKTDNKPSTEELFNLKIEQLDQKIAHKKEIKSVLNKEQFNKYEKMASAKKRMAYQKAQQLKKKKWKKEQRKG